MRANINKLFFQSIKLVFYFSVIFITSLLVFWLNFPLPWLIGALIASILLNFFGFGFKTPLLLRAIILSIVGLQTGALLNDQSVHEILLAPILLMAMLAIIPIYIMISTVINQKILKLNSMESFLCAIPGLLSYVLILSIENKVDTARLSVIQSLRVILIVIFIPLIFIGTSASPVALSQKFIIESPLSLILTFTLVPIIVMVGYWLKRFKLSVPWFILAMTFAASTNYFLTINLSPPTLIITLTQSLLGVLIGSSIKPGSFNMTWRFYLKTILVFMINIVVIALVSYALVMLFTLSFDSVFLSLVPGGLEAMIFISVAIAANPVLVSAIHVARLIYLSFLIPIMLPYYRNKAKNENQ